MRNVWLPQRCGVHDGKHHIRRSDADAQRKNGDGREARSFRERPGPINQIAPEILQPLEPPSRPRVLGAAGARTELAARAGKRFLSRYTFILQFFGPGFDMKPDLVFQFSIELRAATQIAYAVPERHIKPSSTPAVLHSPDGQRFPFRAPIAFGLPA